MQTGGCSHHQEPNRTDTARRRNGCVRRSTLRASQPAAQHWRRFAGRPRRASSEPRPSTVRRALRAASSERSYVKELGKTLGTHSDRAACSRSFRNVDSATSHAEKTKNEVCRPSALSGARSATGRKAKARRKVVGVTILVLHGGGRPAHKKQNSSASAS